MSQSVGIGLSRFKSLALGELVRATVNVDERVLTVGDFEQVGEG